MGRPKGSKSKFKTFDEKKIVVLDHSENRLTFEDLAKKYKISYSAVRKWCLDYEVLGDEALIAKTGKVNNQLNNYRSNSLDPDKREIARLKKVNRDLQMELEVIKKFNEAMETLQKK